MSYPLFRAMVVALPMFVAPAPAFASEVEASAMKYTNDGGYTAQFYIRYNLDDGSNCKVRPKGMDVVNLVNSDTVTYVLSDQMMVKDGGQACLTESGYIREGHEVWGYVEIAYGSNEGCKKDKTVIFRQRGGTIKYKTKGSTLNNNRCQVASWP